MEKLRMSMRERVSDQETRLQMMQDMWMHSAADLDSRMDNMRENVMQEVAGLGHGAILHFMEAFQETTRHKLIHVEDKLNEGLKATRREIEDLTKQLEKTQEGIRRELADLGQRPFFQFMERAQDAMKLEAEDIGKRLDCSEEAVDALRASPSAEKKIREWVSGEIAELQLSSKGLRVWVSDELTRLHFADESLKEQMAAHSSETRRQLEESQQMLSALKLGMISALKLGGCGQEVLSCAGVHLDGCLQSGRKSLSRNGWDAHRTDSTGGSDSNSNLTNGGTAVSCKG